MTRRKTTHPDPLITELFERLPPPDTTWPSEQRSKWFKAAAAIFDLLYGEDHEAEKKEPCLSG